MTGLPSPWSLRAVPAGAAATWTVVAAVGSLGPHTGAVRQSSGLRADAAECGPDSR